MKPKKKPKGDFFKMHLVDRPLIIWNVSDTATMRELPFLTGTSTGTINTLTLPYPSTQKAQLKRKDSNKRTDRTCINRHIHTYRHTAGTNREHIQWDWCRQPSERRRITVHQFTKKKKKKGKERPARWLQGRIYTSLRLSPFLKSPRRSKSISESRSVSVSSG